VVVFEDDELSAANLDLSTCLYGKLLR